jgi:serine/threonine-protein kinase
MNADRWGEYELLERLGQGGMGEVLKARQHGPHGLSRTLVIKRLLPHLAGEPRFVEMFLNESRLTASLTHPNIVQLFALGEVKGQPFMALEYVDGRPLSQVITILAGRSPPPGLGALVARELCRALWYAWDGQRSDGAALRLVHRDVSPSNIMLGFSGAVKLLDFGVARASARAEERVAAGGLLGKPWYMAPERLDGAPCDHRADLFAVGAVLYETLVGRRLFAAQSLAELRRVMRGPTVPPSRLNPAVPRALDHICHKAIAPAPEQRFHSGEEMAAALDEVLFDLKWGSAQLSALLGELFGRPRLQAELGADTIVDEPSARAALPRGLVSWPPWGEPTGLCDDEMATVARPRRPLRALSVGALTAAAGASAHGRPPGVCATTLVRAAPTRVPPDARRRRRWRALLPLAAWGVVMLAGASGVWLGARTREVAARDGGAVALAPATSAIVVESRPSGAALRLDGTPALRGRTPFRAELPRDDQPRKLVLSLPGHRDAEVMVTPRSDLLLDVVLTPLPPRSP